MPKRDEHIHSARSLAAVCFTCEDLIAGEVHEGPLEGDRVVAGREKLPYYCAGCCPVCAARREGER